MSIASPGKSQTLPRTLFILSTAHADFMSPGSPEERVQAAAGAERHVAEGFWLLPFLVRSQARPKSKLKLKRTLSQCQVCGDMVAEAAPVFALAYAAICIFKACFLYIVYI